MTQFEVAQILADRDGITREDMDAFAAESHRRAHDDTGSRATSPARWCRCRSRTARAGDRRPCCERDEGIRPESTPETLAALGPGGQVGPVDLAPDITAGNASQMSDGAAAMLVADRATAERLGLPVRARFVHLAVGAEDAVLVLSAPNRVTRRLLERSGMTIDQFDSIECNEAFAAIALRWAREFLPDGDLTRLQPPGRRHRHRSSPGRLGRAPGDHPAQRPRGHRRPLRPGPTMCEGGGQANATVIERLG